MQCKLFKIMFLLSKAYNVIPLYNSKFQKALYFQKNLNLANTTYHKLKTQFPYLEGEKRECKLEETQTLVFTTPKKTTKTYYSQFIDLLKSNHKPPTFLNTMKLEILNLPYRGFPKTQFAKFITCLKLPYWDKLSNTWKE